MKEKQLLIVFYGAGGGGECRISMIEVLMNGRYDRRWWGVPY